jgi:hypothetical protein
MSSNRHQLSSVDAVREIIGKPNPAKGNRLIFSLKNSRTGMETDLRYQGVLP